MKFESDNGGVEFESSCPRCKSDDIVYFHPEFSDMLNGISKYIGESMGCMNCGHDWIESIEETKQN